MAIIKHMAISLPHSAKLDPRQRYEAQLFTRQLWQLMAIAEGKKVLNR
jgi:hypothetical protein